MIEKLFQTLIDNSNSISVVMVLLVVTFFLFRELRATRLALREQSQQMLNIVEHNTKAMVELQAIIQRLIDIR